MSRDWIREPNAKHPDSTMGDERKDVFRWEDPPQPQYPPRQSWWREVAGLLRERPGQWALIRSFDKPSLAYSARNDFIRGRGARDLNPADFEITVRKDGNSGASMYARYLV